MKDIPGYEGLYAATSCGRIWSHRRKKFLSPHLVSKGYYMVHLPDNPNAYVHILVAKTYIPNPDNLPVVNHKDENPRHNFVNNLEWTTQKENILHSLPYSIRCIETGEEYKTIAECSEKCHIDRKRLSKHLNSGYRLIGAKHFEWILPFEERKKRFPRQRKPRKEKLMIRGNKLGQELLRRTEQLEALIDVLEARIEQLERVTIVDAPNPTTEWGGKENGKQQTAT